VHRENFRDMIGSRYIIQSVVGNPK
jgi:hypothetical protein